MSSSKASNVRDMYMSFAGADWGVPSGSCREAVRGSLGRHPERRLVRDMAVDVPADAAHRLHRPRGPQLAVLRAVQRQTGEPAAEPENAGRHRSQALLRTVASASPGYQDGGDSSQTRYRCSVKCVVRTDHKCSGRAAKGRGTQSLCNFHSRVSDVLWPKGS